TNIVQTISGNFLTFRADKYAWESDFSAAVDIQVLSVSTPLPGVQVISATGTTAFPVSPEVAVRLGNWMFLSLPTATPCGTGDTLSGTAPNITLTDAAGSFTSTVVGLWITITGATTSNNNGTFKITGYTSPTVVTYFNGLGVAEGFPGTYVVRTESAYFL